MSSPSARRVLGVDACPGGWIGVLLDDDGVAEVRLAPRIDDLVASCDPAPAVVGVDIPIGLADAGPRAADLAARSLLRGRASTVFLTPVRAAVEAPTHAAANAAQRASGGTGVSLQAYGLRHRILEVERWIPSYAGRVVEVHPELAFQVMAGRPFARKKSWDGVRQRMAALEGAGIVLDGELGRAGEVANADDVLDAAAVAWTARRVRDGAAIAHPDPPQDLAGWPTAIWV
ncbi:DUF429 domain-containing protein [Mumia sp. DW29H23]|uniref:DUF429 domain-containing protein n=1 Tax=Mumia sp. DW29H23 TaxID=3421241 RepID=UPI003D696C38